MNKFSLLQAYTTQTFVLHDPNDPYSIEHTPQPTDHGAQSTKTSRPFHSHPNENAMRLGDWYWNQGAQKSREDFKQLLSIVGNPTFSAVDVSGVPRHSINKVLGNHDPDRSSDNPEWLSRDHRWKSSPVTILVPFHSRSASPGPKPLWF
jgi:hypothetical protein